MQQGTAHKARVQARVLSFKIGMRQAAGMKMSGSGLVTLILILMRMTMKGVKMRTGFMLQLP